MSRQLRNEYDSMSKTEFAALQVLFTNPHGLTERELADLIGQKRSAPTVQKLRERGVPIDNAKRDADEVYCLLAFGMNRDRETVFYDGPSEVR